MLTRKLLEQSGLTDKQARVYIACVELGSATAQLISRRAGVGRSTAYFILDELNQLGLVSSFDRGKILHFAAANPNKYLKITQDRNKAAERALPELQRLWSQVHGDTRVQFFRGLDNIKSMYDELLSLGVKRYSVFGSTSHWLKADPSWFKDYMTRRAEAGVKVQLIVEKSLAGELNKSLRHQSQGLKVKYIPKRYLSTSRLTSDVTILPDRVVYQNYGREMTSTVLFSKETADLMQLSFDIMWQSIK